MKYLYYMLPTLHSRTVAKMVPAKHIVRNLEKGISFHRTALSDLQTDIFGNLIGGGVEAKEFVALPRETVTVDIHCVTKWSKLGTRWEGVSVDTLLEGVETAAEYVTAFCDGDYTTNLPLEDVTGGKAWVAYAYDGEPLEPAHGGPARLLVPHLYFWKSAKWVRGLQLTAYDVPGFWESLGYHNYGDPWREQRYWGD